MSSSLPSHPSLQQTSSTNSLLEPIDSDRINHPDAEVDESRIPFGVAPCNHNNWDNIRVKKNVVTLWCRDCHLRWRADHPIEPKCPDFYKGMCPRGRECPMLHIHRVKKKRGEAPDPDVEMDQLVPDLQNNPSSPGEPAPRPHISWDNHRVNISSLIQRQRSQTALNRPAPAAAAMTPSSGVQSYTAPPVTHNLNSVLPPPPPYAFPQGTVFAPAGTTSGPLVYHTPVPAMNSQYVLPMQIPQLPRGVILHDPSVSPQLVAFPPAQGSGAQPQFSLSPGVQYLHSVYPQQQGYY